MKIFLFRVSGNLIAHIFAFTAVVIFSFSALASDMPKNFDFSVTFTWSSIENLLKLGDKDNGADWFGDFAATNDKGEVFLNNMFGKCGGYSLRVAGSVEAIGSCVYTDMEGDQIYETFRRNGDKREIAVIGGTGKFAGIQCQGEYSGVGWSKDFSQGVGKKTGSCTRP